MKFSGYLCVLFGAVFVAAAPVTQADNDTPTPGKDREFCKAKCKKDHAEMVEYCKTLDAGQKSCFDLAKLAGSPEGQEECIYYCMRLG
ncbi:predicted protein [Uncinocarpus reesii 1704]|uniref:Big defensin domain-containing protein n=1 Tax=Uncinocarpus reesii (strain UAMH 1704) TaxID=336963 RepID=C4JL64_UNCRE|nr:uncharacterized protein UREG_00399 [Uncinocarpus reesii 1704]EEP75553.1 predicted protein [Uncinocarpus reesii 1704]